MTRISRSLTLFLILAVALLCLGPAAAAPDKPSAQEPFEQGLTALTQGNPTLAMEKFTAAIQLDPKLVEAYINRAVAAMKLEQWAEIGRAHV